MIRIKSQSGTNQYDEDGTPITEWHDKKCAWIVLPEFEKEKIDWWGEDNDFPSGYTLTEYIQQYPNWDKMPNINIVWSWNSKEICQKTFGRPSSFGEKSDYWDKMTYPFTATKQWGYLDYTEKEAINLLKDYFKNADKIKISYNNKIIYEKTKK